MKRVVAILLVIACRSIPGAQRVALFIPGQVESSDDGQALQGAWVRLLTPDNRLIDSTTSDKSGRFTLEASSPGQYEVQARTIGHRQMSLWIDLKRPTTDTLRLMLRLDRPAPIMDCIGPDGRSFGSQFCPGAEMVGLYETGFEPSGFRLCNVAIEGGKWHNVQFEPGVKTSGIGTRTADKSRVVIIVRWLAKFGDPPSSRAVGWIPPIIVYEVLDERAPQVGECGWDGR